MRNPWEEISLETYENHMSLDSVKQLQTMNQMMRDQFEAYPTRAVMILGIAGGNGLEHISKEQFEIVYGVDINKEYLNEVHDRYVHLEGLLKCLHIDLTREADQLPQAELVLANLLIEYIGYPAFQEVIQQIAPEYVSCIIQINTDEEVWVSESPYIHAFDGLDRIHHQMGEDRLIEAMEEIGFENVLQSSEALPNGKKLARLDFRRVDEQYPEECFDRSLV